MVKKRDFRRGELLEKFMVKILYGWDDIDIYDYSWIIIIID